MVRYPFASAPKRRLQHPQLEEQFHTDLHAARGVALSRHLAEGGAGDAVVGASPADTVQNVERLSANLEGFAFSEFESAA
jgi:hypothetical protein